MPHKVLDTVAAFALWTTCSLAAVSTSQYCYTKLGSSSLASIPTKTTRLTSSATQTLVKWSTPKTTTTPDPFVVDVTVTSYDATAQEMPQITDTAFVYVTSTDTSTTTLDTITVQAVTMSTTYTIIGTTTTVPTPLGFLPVSSSIPQSDQQPPSRKRSVYDAAAHRAGSGSLLARAAVPGQCSAGQTPNLNGVCKNSYPQEVDCLRYINTYKTVKVTSTRSTTKTIIAATPTSTNTHTVMQTLTVTMTPPDAQTTSTMIDVEKQVVTSIPSTTTTTIAVDVETLHIPTATSHAICNTQDNFKPVTNYAVDTYAGDDLGHYKYTSFQPTNEACCEACAADPTCEVSAYGIASTNMGTCNMYRLASSINVSPLSCPADGSSGMWFAIQNVASDTEPLIETFEISNGYCGQFQREVLTSPSGGISYDITKNTSG